MRELNERFGLSVEDFKVGDKAIIANPGLLVQSESQVDDVFLVVPTKLSFGDWLGVVNERTGRGYVMANGDYSFL